MKDFIIICLGPLFLIHGFFALAVKEKNFGVIDIAWSLGFVLISLISCILHDFNDLHENIVFAFVLIWGLRLSIFLYSRNMGKPEDHRYEAMRKGWGDRPLINAYFKVFLFQYLLMLIISAPILVMHFTESRPYEFLAYPGVVLCILGFIWEAVADNQKKQFKSKPGNSSKICKIGLWKLSRHPNYFGEATFWWGVFLLSATSGYFWGAIGAGLLNLSLMKFSGVPLIEKRHEGNPEWESYKAITPTLFPSLSILLNSSKKS